MKKGYIEQSKRRNILLITDDIRSHSGVGHIGREIVINTCHKYNWFQLAGSINHPEKGKTIDLSLEMQKLSKVEDAKVLINPMDNYGDEKVVKGLMKAYNIDAIFIITDPRYFDWLFFNECEIRKSTPIAYLNIWDDMPVPHYNREFYESCDALFGISKQTVLINKLVLEQGKIPYEDIDNDKSVGFDSSQRTSPIIIKYIPHGLDPNIFRPLEEDDEFLKTFKKEIFNDGIERDFVLFFNSKNIRRKSLPDAITAWKLFTDSLPEEKRKKCLFVLHTELINEAGTDIGALISYLFGEESNLVKISSQKLLPEQMNAFYNVVDGVILPSSAEGWGLSLTESLLTGTPFIANVTGGMQDQMRFVDENNEWYTNNKKIPSNHQGTYKEHGVWALPVFPKALSLVGSPLTPYIFDSRCNIEDLAEKIKDLYSSKTRKEDGMKGREWAVSDEAGFTSEKMGERVIEGMEYLFRTWNPREKFEFLKDDDFIPRTLNHKLIYSYE
jgi:glycosyltransferase involved in cell wall biosynthesis